MNEMGRVLSLCIIEYRTEQKHRAERIFPRLLPLQK